MAESLPEAEPAMPRAPSQHRYVALVRGINVGGRGILKMEVLRQVFERLGFAGVTTYIQSGNVLFSAADANALRLTRQIEAALESAAGRPLSVFVRSPAELAAAAAANPFAPERHGAELHSQLMFLAAEPDAARQEKLMTLQGEEYRFHLHRNVLYYAYAKEWAGRRRMLDFEKILGVKGTARNWKVVNSLIELSQLST
jgi:uncharacterized protein (DUF1697 family)